MILSSKCKRYLARMLSPGCLPLLVLAAAVLLSPASAGAQSDMPLRRGSLWREVLHQPAEWFGSDEAVRIADNVLLYQHPNGGWGKNIDMTRTLSDEEKEHIRARVEDIETTIDNGATHTEVRFLARVHAATGEERFVQPALRGIEYLLEAQYPNGGWPQFYPLKKGYYSHITFNDGAMIGVMGVLRDASEGKRPFEFVGEDLRRRCREAIDKGLDVILKCQIEIDGRPTAWCAQHDEVDFRPQKARSYELVSLSGMESVGIVEYLMEIDDPSPEVRRAIEGAVRWFEDAKINGLAVKWVRDSSLELGVDRVAVSDPKAGPLWARFYEIGTNRPLYVGRDGVPQPSMSDIEYERRVRYRWLGPFASKLLNKEYPSWRAKWGAG